MRTEAFLRKTGRRHAFDHDLYPGRRPSTRRDVPRYLSLSLSKAAKGTLLPRSEISQALPDFSEFSSLLSTHSLQHPAPGGFHIAETCCICHAVPFIPFAVVAIGDPRKRLSLGEF